MINSAIIYNKLQIALISRYLKELGKTLDHNFWSHGDCDSLRADIKNHYRSHQFFRCCYCQQEINVSHGRAWDIDHIVPKSLHPRFLFEPLNLAVSCIDCNVTKTNKEVLLNPKLKKYPKKSEGFIIIHPHYDNYDEHMYYSEGKFYFGKDEKGNNTIHICDLSRFSFKYNNWPAAFSSTPNIMRLIGEMKEMTDSKEIDKKILEIQVAFLLRRP